MTGAAEIPLPLISEIIAFLSTSQREHRDPAAAERALSAVRERHRDWGLELVWERVSYTGEYHFDLLLRRADETISISCSPDDGLPWPMRGVQRWSESCVARIDGQVISVGTALAAVDFWWSELHVGRRIMHRHVIEHAELDAPAQVSDAELEQAMSEFRQRRRLFSVEQTEEWLRQHGITQAELERHLNLEARGRHLRARVAALSPNGPPAEYFQRHQADFEVLRLATLRAVDGAEAERLVRRLRAAPQSLLSIAQAMFLETGRDDFRFTTVRRGALDPAHQALLSAAPGDVLDPLPTGGGWEVVQLLARAAPRFDAETAEEIQRTLFDQWLEQQAARLRVEWFWGAAEPLPI